MTTVLTAPPTSPSPLPASDRPAFAAPLTAVDSASWQDDSTFVAVKHIVATDPYLEGHYPDFTIYPGVFTIETVYQAAVTAVTGTPGAGGVVLDRIDSVRFLAPLLPGDTLTATLKLTHDPLTGQTTVRARCHRSDAKMCANIQLRVSQRSDADPYPDLPPSPPARFPTRPGSAASGALNHTEIIALLPHRNPMLHVDAVDYLEPGRRIVARKAVSGAERCYRNLRPDTQRHDLRYPLSLVVESLGQAGGVLWLRSAQAEGHHRPGTLIFGSARELTVHGEAYPGDVLRHEVELTAVKGDIAFMRGQTLVGDRLILTVEHIIVLLREEQSLTP